MDFGLFVSCHRLDGTYTEKEVIENALEMVEFADRAGFRIAWFPEHHVVQYIACPSPLMMAVMAASRARRIRVGSAILVVPYYSPLRLAGEIGLADVLTDGRLELGLGRGAFQYEFDRFGIDAKIGVERLREGMDVLEGLFGQDDFEYRGKTVSFGPSTVVPKPLQKPHPPIWIAARSPGSVRWAVARGYNQLATPWREPFSYVETLYRQFAEAIEATKPTRRPKFGVSRMAFVGATEGEALDAMRDIQINHRVFTRLYTDTATVKGGFTVPDPVENEYAPERLLDNLVAGSPDTCIAKLRQYERLGVDHFIMYAGFPLDHAKTMRSLRLFAEKVMPAFAEPVAKSAIR